MPELVQIAVNAHKSWPYHKGRDSFLDVLKLERPNEVLEFTEALTRMFSRIGMLDVCRECWSKPRSALGRFDSQPYGGCCGSCPLLGHDKCIRKPMLCAMWMCSYTSHKFRSTQDFIDFIRARMRWWNAPYSTGVKEEAEREWTAGDLKLLRVLRYAVDGWEG